MFILSRTHRLLFTRPHCQDEDDYVKQTTRLDEWKADCNYRWPKDSGYSWCRFLVLEKETNDELAFLTVFGNRRNFIIHHVYRESSCTERYFHKNFSHHPSQKKVNLQTLAQRATCICETEHLSGQLKHLKEACQTQSIWVQNYRVYQSRNKLFLGLCVIAIPKEYHWQQRAFTDLPQHYDILLM